MNLKFLPLGSVCLVDNSDLKLVVIGYKLNGYDYVAVDYPSGYENESSLRYFNHDQIKDLYSYGYKDEMGKNHFVSLDDGTPNAVNSELSDNGFKFDDVGIVIADETATEVPVVETDNNPGFFFDENGVVVVDTTATEEIEVTPVENNFQFDENGIVVADATAPLIPSVNNFQFDENGIVISDNGMTEEAPVSTTIENNNVNSIFSEVEAPGVIEEHKEEVVFEEKVEEEKANFDIPAPETVNVPEEDNSIATFEETKEETPVVEKKEEKKKRGFFNFGK